MVFEKEQQLVLAEQLAHALDHISIAYDVKHPDHYHGIRKHFLQDMRAFNAGSQYGREQPSEIPCIMRIACLVFKQRSKPCDNLQSYLKILL